MCWTTQGGEKQPGHMFGRGGKVTLSKGGLLYTPLLCYTPQTRLLLVVFCFAHMVLFCVYNVFGGCRVMSTCKGGGS